MKENKTEYPACFGRLEIVFPEGDDGFRSSPESCIPCPHKTECLRTAMKSVDGIGVRQALVDRAYDAGAMGFFERWSRKKILNRHMKNKVKRGEYENHR